MTAVPEPRGDAVLWSAAGLAAGARVAGPGVLAMAVFGVAFGAIAAERGLTLAEATLMSMLLFAGASQFVALEMWEQPMTVAGVAALSFVTAIVNARFILMGAALRPWLGGAPAWLTYPGLSLMTDPGWLLASRYRAQGGADATVFLSTGVVLWLVWIAATMPGHLLGATLGDARRFGLDLVMPCFFIVMLVPLWRGTRRAIPWMAAGTVAMLTSALMPGWWFIMSGALAGSATAGILNERD